MKSSAPEWRKAVIPMSKIAPLIDEWVARNPMFSHNTNKHFRNNEFQEGGELGELARLSGVQQRTIYVIRRGWDVDRRTGGRRRHISFDLADKLLCAMEMNHEWHGRLRYYYRRRLPVAIYEQHRDGSPGLGRSPRTTSPAAKAARPPRTHCGRGHSLLEYGTPRPEGGIRCRACKQINKKQAALRKRGSAERQSPLSPVDAPQRQGPRRSHNIPHAEREAA